MSRISAEILTDISRVLSGIRASLDASSSIYRRSGIDRDRLKSAFLQFESVRYDYRSAVDRYRSGGLESPAGISDLRSGLIGLMEDIQFNRISHDVQFRNLPQPYSRSTVLSPPLIEGRLPLNEAIYLLIEVIDKLIDTAPHRNGQLDIFETTERLRRVLPARQNIAPLKFSITKGRLVLEKQVPSPQAVDAGSIAAAKLELEKSGSKIIEHLSSSNCDRRLIESISDLQDQIVSGRDVVRLGLANIGCGLVYEKFADELPDAVSALLKAHTVGVSMYVAQFPEWKRFSEQAAVAEISEENVPIIHHSTAALISTLAQHPEAADPEVPRLLQSLNRYLENPRETSKRAAFAVWRSVENIVIAIFGYGNSIVKKTAAKIADDLPDAASKLIVRTLMTAALASAVALSPVASHLPDGAWLSRAADLVQKQLEHLAST